MSSEERLERIERTLDETHRAVLSLHAEWTSASPFLMDLRREHPQCQARLALLERIMWAVGPVGLGGGVWGMWRALQ